MTENFWITILITAIITAVIVVMLTKWQSFCKNLWKMICIIAIGALVVCLLCMANYAIFQSFQPHSVRIENSSNVPMEKMVSVESYKATYDLFSSQFSQLLTFLGFFGTIFGLVIPAGAYLLQKQTLKEEKDSLLEQIKSVNIENKNIKEVQQQTQEQLKNVKEENKNIKEMQQQTQEQMKKVNEEYTNIEHLQSELFKSTQTAFDGLANFALFQIVNGDVHNEKKTNLFAMWLIAFDNAVNCAVKAHNSAGLINLIKGMRFQVDLFSNCQSMQEFRNAIGIVHSQAKNESGFVSGEEIQELLGDENKELYEWYKALYRHIYPWKFDGRQKKD